MGQGTQEETAFSFNGNWREFAPILLTNLLLTIVTLGIYRFWGTTRERRYLWANTRFIDDTLEWTGTGLELLIGFVIVLLVLFVPLFGIQFLAQALILQGQAPLAGALIFAIYFLFLYLIGVAIFRALRYRLSRTLWHGIRGGSHDPGLAYGWSYVWKTIVGMIVLGLLIPWSMAKLWAERWNKMSFGPHAFVAGNDWSGLMKRFLLCYLVPLAAVLLGFLTAVSGGGASSGIFGVLALIAILAFYIVLPILALAYYAAFFRHMVGQMSLSTLQFQFEARTKDWLWLFLGNAGLYLIALIVGAIIAGSFGLLANFADPEALLATLANPIAIFFLFLAFIVPLAIAAGFTRYRSWAFFIGHLEASGEVDLAALTQSDTPEPRQGEGLLDAFDMGAV